MKVKKYALDNSSVIWWIFGGCAVTTLYFNSKIQDPFNSPKMWIIFLISAWLVGHIVAKKHNFFKDKSIRIFGLFLFSFTLFGFIAAAVTDVSFTAFFGENQRRNGFLTYLSLTIFMFAAAIFVKLGAIKRLNYVAFFTGMVLGIYGLMQISGLDFVQWNNPYNAVISTVGNPNFAAAVMAMMASIVFGPVLNNSFNFYFRVASLFLTVMLLITIYLSDARQGLIAFAIGVGVYVIIWLYGIKSKLRHLILGSSLFVGVFAILGMLQIGPLTAYLYKNSVSVRGYYWRAGLEMLKDRPIFGVGYDRYGAYFKEFREVGYPLTYGFNITSSNAHNLPIQIFSTTGILTGIAYLSILGFIIWRGIVGIKSNQGNQRLLVASVFSAWLAYQAQSIISIDNIGISIWGWVLGGVVVGVSRQDVEAKIEPGKRPKPAASSVDFNLKQVFVSSVVVAVSLGAIVPLYQVEKNMFDTRMRFNPTVAESKTALYEYASKTLSSQLLEPGYKITSGNYLAASGFTNEGLDVLKEVIERDPRNLDALIALSEFSQQIGNLDEIIKYRSQIAQYDPFNATNYLQLGRIYKALGDLVKMNEMRLKIMSFAPETEEAKQANLELK
jgi:O-antigen ligase